MASDIFGSEGPMTDVSSIINREPKQNSAAGPTVGADDDLSFMEQSSALARPKSAPAKGEKKVSKAEAEAAQKKKDNYNAFIGWLKRKEDMRATQREDQRRQQREAAARAAKEHKRIAEAKERARQEAEREQLDARARWSAVAMQRQRLRKEAEKVLREVEAAEAKEREEREWHMAVQREAREAEARQQRMREKREAREREMRAAAAEAAQHAELQQMRQGRAGVARCRGRRVRCRSAATEEAGAHGLRDGGGDGGAAAS